MTARQFVAALRLVHFSAAEILTPGASNARLKGNAEPPETLWQNIVRTAWLADLARSAIQSPLTVLSGYRTPIYNEAVGGAADSQHLQFSALDLGTRVPEKLFGLLLRWRAENLFSGGLGLYRGQGFVHLDTRGANATWEG